MEVCGSVLENGKSASIFGRCDVAVCGWILYGVSTFVLQREGTPTKLLSHIGVCILFFYVPAPQLIRRFRARAGELPRPTPLRIPDEEAGEGYKIRVCVGTPTGSPP